MNYALITLFYQNCDHMLELDAFIIFDPALLNVPVSSRQRFADSSNTWVQM
jgi:hypothetical protein